MKAVTGLSSQPIVLTSLYHSWSFRVVTGAGLLLSRIPSAFTSKRRQWTMLRHLGKTVD